MTITKAELTAEFAQSERFTHVPDSDYLPYADVPGQSLSDFAVGDRVESHPGTDAWIRGDRFGTVTGIGRKYVHVSLDRSGRTRAFSPVNLIGLVDRSGDRIRVPVHP